MQPSFSKFILSFCTFFFRIIFFKRILPKFKRIKGSFGVIVKGIPLSIPLFHQSMNLIYCIASDEVLKSSQQMRKSLTLMIKELPMMN